MGLHILTIDSEKLNSAVDSYSEKGIHLSPYEEDTLEMQLNRNLVVGAFFQALWVQLEQLAAPLGQVREVDDVEVPLLGGDHNPLLRDESDAYGSLFKIVKR